MATGYTVTLVEYGYINLCLWNPQYTHVLEHSKALFHKKGYALCICLVTSGCFVMGAVIMSSHNQNGETLLEVRSKKDHGLFVDVYRICCLEERPVYYNAVQACRTHVG